MRAIIQILMLWVLCFHLISCADDNDLAVDPDTIRVSVLPDQSPERLQERFGKLLDYLSKETGKQYELILSKDYQDLLDRFHRNEIHLARFGGFTFIKAQLQEGAEPLVMRDVDASFVSFFVVRASDPAKSLLDFKGKKFTFGSMLSTSGHLMPRFFLQREGIIPEQFFAEVHYSGAHDRTVLQVRDGDIDLGSANAVVIKQLFESGQLSEKDVRVLWSTPPYPDYVWAAHPKLSKSLTTRITDAFLRLSPEIEDQAHILKTVAAKTYLPASSEDFTALRSISQQLGLLESK